jgi:hypothetical protein
MGSGDDGGSFDSHRRFQVWRYTVSMRQLLLRSTKTADVPTRVDVFFQDVQSIDLPTAMDELRVEMTAPREYRLTGKGWSGRVNAALVRVAEDGGEYNDPSSLFIGGL